MAARRRSPPETVGLALLALNLLAPAFDPPHPARWLYDGAARLFEGWIAFIGWIMHFSDPLLPRTFTIPGTANFILSTLLSVAVFVAVGWVLGWIWRRLDARPKRGGTAARWRELGRRPALWWALDAGLLALLVPTAVRLLG